MTESVYDRELFLKELRDASLNLTLYDEEVLFLLRWFDAHYGVSDSYSFDEDDVIRVVSIMNRAKEGEPAVTDIGDGLGFFRAMQAAHHAYKLPSSDEKVRKLFDAYMRRQRRKERIKRGKRADMGNE